MMEVVVWASISVGGDRDASLCSPICEFCCCPRSYCKFYRDGLPSRTTPNGRGRKLSPGRAHVLGTSTVPR